jgi:predicted nucleic acid-binding protein
LSLILDASVTLAWIYPDETTDPIRRVFDSVAADGAVVPALWRLEVANGLTQAMRSGRISPAMRAGALADLELLGILIDTATDANAWGSSLQLADRFGLTLPDAAYLELAQRRSLPLASLDRDLRSAAQALQLPVMGL